MGRSYYKYHDTFGSPIGDCFTYLEIEEDNWARRQISWNGTDYIASNVIYPPWDLILPDQPIDEPFDDLIPITREEFEKIWGAFLATRHEIWDEIKKRFPIGSPAEGHLLVFLPQGVIVNMGDNTLGVADRQACRASTKPEYMYPKHRVTATVSGYDEENQWLILTSPTVHSDEVQL